MSQWTHVNGNIRFDLFQEYSRDIYYQLVDVIGKIQIGGLNDTNSDIPCGSEGSVYYSIVNASRGRNIVIYGDLRDYGSNEDIEKIYNWFAKIINHKFKAFINIRDAVLKIEVEYNYDLILYFDRNAENRISKIIKNKEHP